jgi:dTDP-4-amino-4,6-dideoxygalactose transaminase
VLGALTADDIESRPLWKPMHLQPLYAGAEVVANGVSADLFSRGLCLPSGSALTDDDVARVCSVIRAATA